MRTIAAIAFAASVLATPVIAQTVPPPEVSGDIRPGEVQGLFDAYVLVQVQDSLGLGEADYTRLLPRLRVLQQVRRRSTQERQRLTAELRKLTDPKLPQPTDDTVLQDRLSAFQELESRGAAELRRAQDGVDEVLTIRQRARFRVFEENVERRKLQLLLRATRRAQRPSTTKR